MYEIRMELLIGKVDAKLFEPVLSVRRYEGRGSRKKYGCRPCRTAGWEPLLVKKDNLGRGERVLRARL